MDFAITPVHGHDLTQASSLLQDKTCAHLIADRGYDSDRSRPMLREKAIVPVIPPRSHRLHRPPYALSLYQARLVIERFFNRIKHHRRLATRYEKTAQSYAAKVALSCILTWLHFGRQNLDSLRSRGGYQRDVY